MFQQQKQIPIPSCFIEHGNPICTTQTSNLQTATCSTFVEVDGVNIFCSDGSEMIPNPLKEELILINLKSMR